MYHIVGMWALFNLPLFKPDVRHTGRQDARYTASLVGGVPSATATATAATRVEDLGSGNYTLSYKVTLTLPIQCGKGL